MVKCQRPKRLQYIFIHIYEVFVTNICISEDLCLNISEYQSVLCAAIYRLYLLQNVRIYFSIDTP